MSTLRFGILMGISLSGGCGTGTFSDADRIGSSGGEETSEAPVGPGPGENAPGASCESLGPRLLRRLSSEQFRKSLVDLFEDVNVPSEDVLTDPVIEGFRTSAKDAVIRDLAAQQLMTYAEKVSAWAVSNKTKTLSSCQEQTPTCRKETIEKLARRAFREPVSKETLALYDALLAGESSFESGLELVLTAMLQSPNFLYRRELGRPSTTGNYVLTPHQIAENLSYLLTDGPPDAELRAASDEGRLETAEDIDREARRLLASDASHAPMSQFLQGWLRLDKLASKAKDETRFPLSPELRIDMLRESEELFLHTLQSGAGTEELFNAQYTFATPELAAFYQLPAPAAQGAQQVDLTGHKRAPGLLGHGAFLATHALSDAASPVQRGVAVRTRLLCQKLSPPPADVDTNLDPNATFANNRERYAAHSQDARCSSCHRLIDSIGFTLERYDAIGRYSDQHNGQPIDESGGILAGPEGDITLASANELTAYLSTSPAVESCLVEHYALYAYGLDEWTGHACALDAVKGHAQAEGASLESLLLAVVQSAHFTTRAPDL